MKLSNGIGLTFVVFLGVQCTKPPIIIDGNHKPKPTPYELVSPPGFPINNNIPGDNPMTVEGIALGRKLFFDPILSGDNTLSCAGCHSQETGFTDSRVKSVGITGAVGFRNSTVLINLAWSPFMFWGGRDSTIEHQALRPVPNSIEMNLPWEDAVMKLQRHHEYPKLFKKAFDSIYITNTLVAKAIAQFERTLISADSKFDQVQAGTATFTPAEQRGHDIFFSPAGTCFKCHGGALITDNDFHDIGLDIVLSFDMGRGLVTQNPSDNGKFKTPTLRNIAVSAPYMHDGRFNTLADVIEFYSSGILLSANLDTVFTGVGNQGLQFTNLEKQDLLAFLETLTDTTFLNNPDFSAPQNFGGNIYH